MSYDCQTSQTRVGEPPHYFHWHTCTRRARWLVNGKPQCTQHLKQWKRNALVTGEKLTVTELQP